MMQFLEARSDIWHLGHGRLHEHIHGSSSAPVGHGCFGAANTGTVITTPTATSSTTRVTESAHKGIDLTEYRLDARAVIGSLDNGRVRATQDVTKGGRHLTRLAWVQLPWHPDRKHIISAARRHRSSILRGLGRLGQGSTSGGLMTAQRNRRSHVCGIRGRRRVVDAGLVTHRRGSSVLRGFGRSRNGALGRGSTSGRPVMTRRNRDSGHACSMRGRRDVLDTGLWDRVWIEVAQQQVARRGWDSKQRIRRDSSTDTHPSSGKQLVQVGPNHRAAQAVVANQLRFDI